MPSACLIELDRYFRDLESRDLYSGVVRITRGGSELFAGSYGFASRAWKIRNTLETRFDTASVTKLFTAVAVLQLIDRGRFSLETRVVDFLGLTGTAISADVTVYHLLTHTSGIADDADEEAGESYEEFWKTKPNYVVLETADFLPQFIHKPANFAPGQGSRYCNCGYLLLGLAVEKAGGLSYRDFVRQNVFERAGMTGADFLRMDRVNENVAEGSDPLRDAAGRITGWKKNIYSFPPIGSPDGGAILTARDLDQFHRALQAGVLLSPELTEAFVTPQVHYRDREGWTMKHGLGLWFHVGPSGEIVAWAKEGINAGASAFLKYFPATDITVVLLSNMEDGVWGPERAIHDLVVGGGLE